MEGLSFSIKFLCDGQIRRLGTKDVEYVTNLHISLNSVLRTKQGGEEIN